MYDGTDMTTNTQQELTALRRVLLSMSASAEQSVSQAFEALYNRDPAAARRVRKSDRAIDKMELDIDAECLRVLALHNPVASDLRFVISSLRISVNLERIADYAKSVAKRVIDLCELPEQAVPPVMREMMDAALQMLADACRSLAEQDADLALRVRQSDDYVDERYRQLFEWAAQQMTTSPDSVPAIIDMLSITRAVERIADHATSLAADVIFAVGGERVRHPKAQAQS